MTTNLKKASAHKVVLPPSEIIRAVGNTSDVKVSVALCHQLRVVDRRAFEDKLGKLSQNAVLAGSVLNTVLPR